jgi:predicted DNA-binding antitoxin AbrB/MazE fold protein
MCKLTNLERNMETLFVDENSELRIERRIIDKIKLKPGEEVRVSIGADRIEIMSKSNTLKGFLKGLDTNFDREKERI